MRTAFAASTTALFTAVLLAGCASSDATSEDVDSTSDELAIRGIVVTPPVKKVKPPLVGGIGGGMVADPNPPACSSQARFDLRRKTRSCEDLPGAYVEGGVTFVPGTGGRYRVGRLLAGTAAPESIQAKACSYTWEPSTCVAPPDTAKLLVEPEPNERLHERPSTCLTNPASCASVKVPETTRVPVSWFIPTGPGRCDVCGYAKDRSIFVVLPPYYRGFDYTLAGEPTRYVFLDNAQSAEPSIVEVQLDHDVLEQDVSIYNSFTQ